MFRIGDYRTIDWVHDSVKDQFRKKKLRSMTGLRGVIVNSLDSMEGWVLVGLIGIETRRNRLTEGFVTALIAYCIDVWESVLFDWKEGYCTSMVPLEMKLIEGNWTLDRKFCCWNVKRYAVSDDL
jgi:chloride channel 3/4/5